MKLITLMENTTTHGLKHEHGLSLYIETPQHKILFDMGPNGQFLDNAQRLGVDISRVDAAFLSHGHYDHGGGLAAFCERNTTAPVYIQGQAFRSYYAVNGKDTKYVGLDPALAAYEERFILVDGGLVIDEELRLFSHIPTGDYLSEAGKTLRVETDGGLAQDSFSHEQNLLISAEGKHILIAGCAHKGFVNILRAAEELLGGPADHAFSGFHLYNPSTGATEGEDLVEAIAAELQARPTRYVTGHCTGSTAFDQLRRVLGPQIAYMDAGAEFVI